MSEEMDIIPPVHGVLEVSAQGWDGAGEVYVADDVTQAARYIEEPWQAGVAAIIETGRRLVRVRDRFRDQPGKWSALLGRDGSPPVLRFAKTHAYRLIAIAEGADRLVPHVGHLPADTLALHELVKLPDDAFDARLADGTIRADMQRKDISVLARKERRAAREQELGDKQAKLAHETHKFGVIWTDDEWEHEPWSDAGLEKAAVNHYPVSSLEALKQRNIAEIAAPDCVYFMWSTVPHLAQAIALMAHRGFAYKTSFIWSKIYPGAGHGMGYWGWIDHEYLLIGTRGNVPAPAPGEQWHSVIEAPVGSHSQKPLIFHELVEAYFPSLPKIELNRRGVPRHGWWAWGNEVAGDAALGIVVDDNGFADASHLALPEKVGTGFSVRQSHAEQPIPRQAETKSQNRGAMPTMGDGPGTSLDGAEGDANRHLTTEEQNAIITAGYRATPRVPVARLALATGLAEGAVYRRAGRLKLTDKENQRTAARAAAQALNAKRNEAT